jgi:hypothetical protein
VVDRRVWRAAILIAVAMTCIIGTCSSAVARTSAAAPTRGFHASPPLLAGSGVTPFATPAVIGSGNLSYHSGPVMTGATKTVDIFWEPATLQSGAPGTVSTVYNGVLDNVLLNERLHGLFNNVTQYSHLRNTTTRFGPIIDTSPYPPTDCPYVFATTEQRTNCLSDQAVFSEVQKVMGEYALPAGLNTLFLVFIDKGEYECADDYTCFLYPLDANGYPQGFCAYHAYRALPSTTVVYAAMPYGDTPFSSAAGSWSSVCTSLSAFPNDRAADIEASEMTHEQMEMLTDPTLSAWYDSDGYEIADKCQDTMSGFTLDGGLANERWKNFFASVQTEWDNTSSGCVAGGSLTPSPRSAARGAKITLTGANYDASQTITLTLRDNHGVMWPLGTVSTSAAGGFTTTVTIPASATTGSAQIRSSGPHPGDTTQESFKVS